MNRFNRYIVECKWKRIDYSTIFELRFNRYIVECKYALVENLPALQNDLIDT